MQIRIYKTVVLPVVLYWCEIWSLILREERRRKGFENRVLRRTFERKRRKMIGSWRKLYNEELHNLYSSSTSIIRMMKSRRMRWTGYVAQMGENEYV
jgi:hypothetical protein